MLFHALKLAWLVDTCAGVAGTAPATVAHAAALPRPHARVRSYMNLAADLTPEAPEPDADGDAPGGPLVGEANFGFAAGGN